MPGTAPTHASAEARSAGREWLSMGPASRFVGVDPDTLRRWADDGRVRTYSTGMKQKLALAQVFSDPVDILILDEPTSALDPSARALVLGLVQDAREHRQTVVFSGHGGWADAAAKSRPERFASVPHLHPGEEDIDGFVAEIKATPGIVGLRAVIGYPPTRGIPWTAFTCTARAVRGRGIARALKYATIAQAIEQGAREVETQNDTENAPILHLNQEMGYRPAKSQLELHRTL